MAADCTAPRTHSSNAVLSTYEDGPARRAAGGELGQLSFCLRVSPRTAIAEGTSSIATGPSTLLPAGAICGVVWLGYSASLLYRQVACLSVVRARWVGSG